METVNENVIMRELRALARERGQSALSRDIDITPQLMCDVLKARRKFGHRILDYLGYEEISAYVRKKAVK